MKKYKWFALSILLVLLVVLYLGARFYIYVKPPSGSFPLKLKWQAALGHSTHERPAYQDGLVLFSLDGILGSYWYGLDATTGRVVWSQRVPSYSFLRCLTPEYLILSGPSSLLALKPHSGEIIWEGELGHTATS